MDYKQALAEIKKGRVGSLYLLHGEETFLARQIEKAAVEAVLAPEERSMGLAVFDRDPPAAELATLIETVPFLGEKNVIIIRDTQLFRAGKKTGNDEGGDGSDAVNQRLLDLLADMPDYTHLMFVASDKVDKRRKVFKVVEANGTVVDIGPLKPKDVRPWVMAKLAEMGRKMTPSALERLLSAVSMMPQISLGFLDREMEKIALYAAKEMITSEELKQVMSAVPEISVFAMIEALSQKQAGKALKLLMEQFAAGENAIRLIALLAWQVRLLLGAKDLAGKGMGSEQVAGQLGVPPFVGEKLIRQSAGFTVEKLRQTMVLLAEADRDLKSGRTDKFVLEQIIILMCR